MMKKDSYSIGEAADILGISKEMIRYYEKSGALLPERGEIQIQNFFGDGYIYASGRDTAQRMGHTNS